MSYHEWRSYVPVAARRRNAEKKLAKLKKNGHGVFPVTIAGRAIAKSFWGKSWCANLERYSDYENRLPDLRPQRLRHRLADRKKQSVGGGQRLQPLQGDDHYRPRYGETLEGHLPGLRGDHRFAG
jgi:hypothetical protein